MTTQIATNQEQYNRLIACGINPASVDMGRTFGGIDHPTRLQEIGNVREYEYWNHLSKRGPCGTDVNGITTESAEPYYRIEFAWSLSALLAMLPRKLYDEYCYAYCFSLAKDIPLYDKYRAAYIACMDGRDDLVSKTSTDPVEACVQLIEWLTAHNYKLNNQ